MCQCTTRSRRSDARGWIAETDAHRCVGAGGARPEEYETLREEARAMAHVVVEAFSAQMAGLDEEALVTEGREMMVSQDAANGRDEVLANVPCRVFNPAGEQRRGTYYHIHGGGLVWGSPRMNDVDNDELSKRLGIRVVSVDYRLAPEHPFPAGSNDCLSVARWVLENEPGTVAIGGESAGGYLCGLTLLRIRDELDAIDRVCRRQSCVRRLRFERYALEPRRAANRPQGRSRPGVSWIRSESLRARQDQRRGSRPIRFTAVRESEEHAARSIHRWRGGPSLGRFIVHVRPLARV